MRESDSMRKRGKKKEEEENGTFFHKNSFQFAVREKGERERERGEKCREQFHTRYFARIIFWIIDTENKVDEAYNPVSGSR